MTDDGNWKQQALHHCNRADQLQKELEQLQAQFEELAQEVEDPTNGLRVRHKRQSEMIESLRRTNDDLHIDVTALTVWRQKVSHVLRDTLGQIQQLVEDG